MKKLQAFSDPGHGWLKVKRSELVMLDILNKISQCSYERGEYVYLEEDCDAGIYCNALRLRGIEYTVKTKFTNRQSKIRTYPSFSI